MRRERIIAAIVLAAMFAVCLVIGASLAPERPAAAYPPWSQPPVSGAGNVVPPASWSAPAWYIDPSNVTGCASDNNTCTSATCGDAGAVGPCLTWRQVNDVRWNCQGNPLNCPKFYQNTTITFLSSQTTNTDYVSFTPGIYNNAAVVLQGSTATVVSTSTITSLTIKAAATNTLLAINFANGASASQGQFIVDSTKNNSKAWPYQIGVGAGVGPWTMSQPMLPVTVPLTNLNAVLPAERNTWQNGDSVTLNQPNVILVGQIKANVFDQPDGGSGTIFPWPLVVYNLTFGAENPYFNSNSAMHVGGDVILLECGANQFIVWEPGSSLIESGLTNCGIDNLWGGQVASHAGNPNVYPWRLIGGSTGPAVLNGGSASQIDGDALTNGTLLGSWNLGNVAFTGQTILDMAHVETMAGCCGVSVPHIYGAGPFNVGTQSFFHNSQGTAFGTLLPISLQMNGQTSACACMADAGLTSCGTTLTGSALASAPFNNNACTPLGVFVGIAGP